MIRVNAINGFKNSPSGYYNILMLSKTIILSVFLLVAMLTLAEARVPDVVSEQRDAVVTVYVDDRHGTHIESGAGFIVDQQGIIVTGCRIIAKWLTSAGSALSVAIEGRGTFPVEEVISSKCENSLALIKIKADDLPAVKIARDLGRGGEEIVLIKKRPGSEAAFFAGRTLAFKGNNKSFQISLRVSGEDNGSPLFNMNGEVVGVGIVQPRKGKNVVSAVSPRDILKQLGRYKKPRALIESGDVRSKTDKEPSEKTDGLQDYFSRGCAFDQTNMYKEAIEAYRQALRINPDLAEAYINLGVDYYRVGRYDDAINIFKQIIGKKPDLIAAYNKLGAAYIVNGQYSEAIETFKKAIEIAPDDASAHFNLGLAYFLNGDMISAHTECNTLRDIDKEKANSLIDLIY